MSLCCPRDHGGACGTDTGAGHTNSWNSYSKSSAGVNWTLKLAETTEMGEAPQNGCHLGKRRGRGRHPKRTCIKAWPKGHEPHEGTDGTIRRSRYRDISGESVFPGRDCGPFCQMLLRVQDEIRKLFFFIQQVFGSVTWLEHF